MIFKMFLTFIFTLCCTYYVHGAGEFTIVHHPSSIAFKGHEHLRESLLKEVYSVALGFSSEEYTNWKGIRINDPFNLAKAVVTVAVDGVTSIGQTKGYRFNLISDANDDNVYHSLERRLSDRYPVAEADVIYLDLGEGLENVQNYDIFKGIKEDKVKKNHYPYLKSDIEEDRNFLNEMDLLKSIANKIQEQSYTTLSPSIYWFRVSSFHALVDLHGENSTTVIEARQLLNKVIVELSEAYQKAYEGDVLITTITSDASHTRRARNILAVGDATDVNTINVSKVYSPNYPVIFNIMLWLSIILGFSILAVALATGTMDPGRDSIIYRMTNTRMKKEN